jgi:hypothetical protein
MKYFYMKGLSQILKKMSENPANTGNLKILNALLKR